MSGDLTAKIQLGLEELATVREQISPLISKASASSAGAIETAAACALLHSFYTEIEKILKRIALEWDGEMPSSGAWHKDLLNQMAAPTSRRPAVISTDLVEQLSEFLAFRHLFRGSSIALMRWEKLSPLLANVDPMCIRVRLELEAFCGFLHSGGKPADT